MVEGCTPGPSDIWYVVDDGGSVHFRHAPRMDARVTNVRPAASGELLQAVAEACQLPAGWVQVRPVKGAPGLGGLWLPKQFLLTPRAYEMAGIFLAQERQKRAPPPSPPPAPPPPPASPPPAPPSSAVPSAGGACVDEEGVLKVGTCAANKLHPGCDFDLHTLHGGVLYGAEFIGVTVGDICPKTCGRCS